MFSHKYILSVLIICMKVRPDEYQSDSWEDNSYKIYDPSDYPEGTIDIPRWAQVPQCLLLRQR